MFHESAYQVVFLIFLCVQSVIQDSRFSEVRRRLLEEIKATQKRIHPVHATTFNNSMKNKIDHAIRILRLMDQYPHDC